MATWDASLPAPETPGYQLSPVDQTLRTGMEVGAARSRRISKARNDRVDVSWIFTDAEMATFRTWFEDDSQAAGGSAFFTISLAVGTTGIDSKSARFIGPYQSKLIDADHWSVTASLEVRDA